MPPVVADGQVMGGLNSGEDAGAWRSWGGTIAAEQKRTLTAWLNWGLGKIFAATEGPTGGRVPATWRASWRPIAEPDAEIEARVGEIEARTDKIYGRDLGSVLVEDLARWRHVEGRRGPVRVERVATATAAEALDARAATSEAARVDTGPKAEQPSSEVADRRDLEGLAVDSSRAAHGRLPSARAAAVSTTT
jgi:hypothetical protein